MPTKGSMNHILESSLTVLITAGLLLSTLGSGVFANEQNSNESYDCLSQENHITSTNSKLQQIDSAIREKVSSSNFNSPNTYQTGKEEDNVFQRTTNTVSLIETDFEGSDWCNIWDIYCEYDYANAYWDRSFTNPQSGSYSCYCAGAGFDAWDAPPYPENMYCWMDLTIPLDVSDATYAAVSFDYWAEMAMNDWFMFYASPDYGMNWYLGALWSAGDGQWSSKEIDLTTIPNMGNPCGSSNQLLISFGFSSNTDGNVGTGVYLDNIEAYKELDNSGTVSFYIENEKSESQDALLFIDTTDMDSVTIPPGGPHYYGPYTVEAEDAGTNYEAAVGWYDCGVTHQNVQDITVYPGSNTDTYLTIYECESPYTIQITGKNSYGTPVQMEILVDGIPDAFTAEANAYYSRTYDIGAGIHSIQTQWLCPICNTWHNYDTEYFDFDEGETDIAARQAAYTYAENYWDKVCSDGYFYTEYGCDQLPLGTNIVGMDGNDCAHFVSCCIGSEPHNLGGGLMLDTTGSPGYGICSASDLGTWLIDNGIATEVTSISDMEQGDVIIYDWTDDGTWDHAALYLGEDEIAAHTSCHWGPDDPSIWTLGAEDHRLLKIHSYPVVSVDYDIQCIPEWTFMVYVAADNNLEGAGIDDFLEMASVGSNNVVNIVVQLDRTAGYDNTYSDWITTKRYKIEQGMTPDPGSAIMDIAEANMGDPQTLVDFVDWATGEYPASRYCLILWDHGTGWGKRTTTHKGICWDATNGNDWLTTNELGDAMNTISTQLIQNTLGGDDLDILGFDACVMAMIENYYELGETAKIYIGSEETEGIDGWEYDLILQQLKGYPMQTSASFATEITQSYVNVYDEPLSAFDSETMTNADLVGKVNQFSNLLSEAVYEYYPQIWDARDVVQTFCYTLGSVDSCDGDTDHIDLWDFVDNIQNYIPNDTDLVAAAQEVKNAIDAACIANPIPTNYQDAHGIAIYFERNKNGMCYEINYNDLLFSSATQWDEFLQKFLSDEYETDDWYGSATVLSVDGPSQLHIFDEISDQDWMKFQADKGKTYIIETSDLGPDCDTYLILFGTDGTSQLAADDNGGSGVASKIIWECPGTGTYYIRCIQEYATSWHCGPATYYTISSKEAKICGDGNKDGSVNVSDAVWIINYVFLGGEPPEPLCIGDANADGSVNISDAVWIINYVFIGGKPPHDSNGDGIVDSSSNCDCILPN